MPTALPRYAITRTPAVARSLAAAAKRWPEDADRPSRLILRLLEAGEQALESDADRRRAARRAALDALADEFDGLYEPGYLEELRKDWPE
ncbi:hypothetical protein [Microbacterium marinilacus]|uniref:CopG family transcriptional regulator n=1 Tax=Microbacterium marinilacus TaxID=415209 RepID=A0ABP7BVF1_9MICO|nr:hypothetical protein [Microbacterium marinilacus]MBY0688092.1 hypothetical protein [Microbacterium marinilacus]